MDLIKKVYCKNCRLRKGGDLKPYFCEHATSINGGILVNSIHCIKEAHNCNKYKLKWWKWWVK